MAMNQQQPMCYHPRLNGPASHCAQAGFTLLEIIMVMLVLSVIAGLTAPIFSQGMAALFGGLARHHGKSADHRKVALCL